MLSFGYVGAHIFESYITEILLLMFEIYMIHLLETDSMLSVLMDRVADEIIINTETTESHGQHVWNNCYGCRITGVIIILETLETVFNNG